jgi:hypothetical protein
MSGVGNSEQLSPLGCAEISALLVFYSCDELSDTEKTAVDEHLAACSGCAEQLALENALLNAVTSIQQPADLLDSSGVLLAQCRSELSEKIEDLTAPVRVARWEPFGWARRWMAQRPAWSAAGLVVFGVVLGTQLVPWLETANDVAGPAVNVLAAPKLTDDQLAKMAVDNIHFSPAQGAAGENIQLQLNAEQPLELSGNVNDSDVRRVLMFVLKNGERFDTGKRLDCLDALRVRTDDEQVRQAMLVAARKDPNAAVRMKALEALRDTADDDAVHSAMLDILDHDASPGVRIEAVNLLVHSYELDALNGANPSEDPARNGKTIRALTELQQKDPNRDVRLRSAAALRQLGARSLP